MRLAAKVAVITGGGSGIGRAIAYECAAEGARVVVIDRNAEGARETAAHIEAAGGAALAVQADVTNGVSVATAMADALRAFGQIDILVNNAAAGGGDDILTIDEVVWDARLAVVLKSVYLCAKAVLPHMIARRCGALVNISSVNGLAAYGEEAYSAAKAGVINLTQNLAVRYGQYGVRANCVCPGTIRTPIWQLQLARNPQIFDQLARWYPLGRVGEPEDVAKAVVFLASDDAAWITGAVLPVDGGLTAGNYRMGVELDAGAE